MGFLFSGDLFHNFPIIVKPIITWTLTISEVRNSPTKGLVSGLLKCSLIFGLYYKNSYWQKTGRDSVLYKVSFDIEFSSVH